MKIEGKTILVTGGTGSWGQVLTKKLLQKFPKEIRIYSRNEFNQVAMKRKFNDKRLKFIIGNVRDAKALDKACQGVDYLFHLAALKHVPVCELYPWEAIKTNIIGTQNVIDAAIKNKVKKVIGVSSDKACAPINLYGMTKGIGEKLIINAASLNNNTQFLVIRGGNVMGSNGSVIPYFIDQIKRFGKVTVTDIRMTRFFLTLEEAIDLLLIAGASKYSSGLFVMKMPKCKIIDLAQVLIDYYGSESTEIKEIGILSGEKIHEVLVSKDESPNTYIYNDNYYLIYSQKKLDTYDKVTFKEFNSNQALMNKEQIIKLLYKGGFLK